jgi:hypothetical protein
MENNEWRNLAPPVKPEQAHINPPHLQQLMYNPNYYTPNEDDLLIGDSIVIGTYASDYHGNPSIRWSETNVIGLPLKDFYHLYVKCLKHK